MAILVLDGFFLTIPPFFIFFVAPTILSACVGLGLLSTPALTESIPNSLGSPPFANLTIDSPASPGLAGLFFTFPFFVNFTPVVEAPASPGLAGLFFTFPSLKALKKRLDIDQIKFEKESRKIGFDIIPISTDQDFVEPLLSLFKAREKRN